MAQTRREFDADLPKAPTRRIVRGQEQTAWVDGFRFLDEAKLAFEAERQRGYAEGRDMGTQEASRLLAETAIKVDRYLATLDKQMAGLALDIVRRMLGEFDGSELVARAAATALADFRRDKALKVSVHPSAQARVSAYLTSNPPRADLTVTVESDAALGLTDCIVASDAAVINASLDVQLAAMAQALGLDGEMSPA